MTTHSGYKSREYQAWRRIKQSCKNKNFKAYKNIGAVGVRYDPKWEDFIAFQLDMGDMPESCNSIVRIDPKLDFCKLNCRWANVAQGRPRKIEKVQKKESRRRRIKNPKTICFNMEQAHYDYIKKMALSQYQQTGFYVEVNDLIRDALRKAYPCPELYDLFGKEIK